MPTKYFGFPEYSDKIKLIVDTVEKNKLKIDVHGFECPEHKEATYAQCSRLYGACLDLPEDEVLIVSDIDMGNFKIPEIDTYDNCFCITGNDLVPKGQYPMCYITAQVKNWRIAFRLHNKTYQECLDELLGDIECESFRGNYWGKDQETAFDKISKVAHSLSPRSNGQNQFALNRVDRTDLHYKDRWDRFNLIDAHLWRPGYSEENFPKILELMQFMYPQENFTWLIDYTNAYKQLL